MVAPLHRAEALPGPGRTGRPGLAQQIERQCDLASYLSEQLGAAGWLVVNNSPVGVVNFTHPALGRGAPTALQIQQQLEKEGAFWLSTIPFPGHGNLLRACITSFHTQAETIDGLVQRLNQLVTVRAEVLRTREPGSTGGSD